MIASRRRPGITSRKSSSRLRATSVVFRQAGDVAARSETRRGRWPTGSFATAKRSDDRSRLFCRDDRGTHRDNDIDLEADELGRVGIALTAALCPAILDSEG